MLMSSSRTRLPASRTAAAVSVARRPRVVRAKAVPLALEDDAAAGTELGAQDAVARSFALACAEIADETKCQDISVLHVAPTVSWTSYMVLATVFSRPQLLAALARLERMVEQDYPDRERQNTPGTSPWECVDFGDVVVHLFTAEQREVYDLEGFYAQSEEIDLPWALNTGDGKAGSNPSWTKQYQ